MTLPVDDALPALAAALAARNVAVLEAPPGAGKTTRVPLALLHAPWLDGQRIVMLEPRRLAARNAAHFMARQLGERVGDTVGYRVRGETRVGPRTRIEIVTEGVLARMRAADPSLDHYGLVIFDEFHERSLHADLGLALVLQSQELLRAELRVLVMSATLDGEAVASLIGSADAPAPVVRSAGRMYPVETVHRPPRRDERLEVTVARTVREVVADRPGDVLVFLPGAGEQRRVAAALGQLDAPDGERVTVHVLHGTQSFVEQEAAIAPAPAGTRKVVLATSVAETSLTIEGVRTVVDAGLSRLPRYSPRTGLTRLETVRVSRASADQRRGRAGRVAAGWCYRLWDAHEDAMLVPRTRPEMLDADLSGLALELADNGVREIDELRWMDMPPSGAFTQAYELLQQLGALDDAGRITTSGRVMARLPLAPRLAHMVVAARTLEAGTAATYLAALLEERDVLRGDRGEVPADLRLRMELLARTNDSGDGTVPAVVDVSRDGVRAVMQRARELSSRVDVARASRDDGASRRDTRDTRASTHTSGLLDHVGLLVAMAYPDRIAQRRAGSGRDGQPARFLLRNGTGGRLPAHDALANAEFLAVADLDGEPPDFRIVRAAPITREEIETHFADVIQRADSVEWDEDAQAIRAWQRDTLGALVLSERRIARPDSAAVSQAVGAMLRRRGADRWPWSPSSAALRARLAFLHAHDPSWPDVSSTVLEATLETWLGERLATIRSYADVERIDWHGALLSMMTWEQRPRLDVLAPTHVEVPSGSRIAVDYTDAASPVLAVKLQELFGLADTPRILDGRVPLTLHLLSPAQRPVQVTRDLAGFWRTSYFDVRRELRGRYPRHPWPEDPMSAPATRRAKPRGT